MFQNIRNDNIEYNQEEVELKNKKVIDVLKGLLTKQNIILYIISFMISTVGFGDNINPFAIALLAAVCSNDVPIGIIYILSLVGTWVGFGKDGLLIYFLASLIFIGSLYLFKIRINEKTDNKRLGKRVCMAVFCAQAIKLLFGRILVYDILISITYVIAVGIFYKIFEGAVRVIKNSKEKKAFAIEEVLAASLLISIAVCGFKDTLVFGYSLRNILSILVVLVLGWQNGILVGASSGIIIGLVLGIIGSGDITQIASYAISGMISGLLNKLGKIGVIAGFILGNAFLTYVSNGDTSQIIKFQEILIASIGLLAMPKAIKLDIDDLFGKTKYLPVTNNNKLKENEETIYKLNNVSDVISEVAKSYKEVAATVLEKDEVNEKYYVTFKEELEKSILDLENNILYDNFMEEENIYEDIFDLMCEKSYITKEDIINILEKNNNYIIQVDDDETSHKIDDDINSIIRLVSAAYRISKLNSVYDKKIEKSKENMGNQLEGISKAINSIVENLTEEEKNDDNSECCEKLKEILNKKELEVNNVKINKNKDSKLQIDVYTKVCSSNKIEECKCDKIEKILNKQLKDRVKLTNEKCSRLLQSDICKLRYTNIDKYNAQVGIAKATKHGSAISGDSNLNVVLEDGKKLLAISDGMGSGPKARQSSNIAIKLLKRALLSGFDKETSIELINSSICLNSKDETYATLDMAILDLYKGNIEFIKNGACPTYIKNKKNVDIIKTISIPTGILENIDLEVFDRDLEDGDILVMCSDGIIESCTEYENKELWLKYLLEEIETQNSQKIADLILQEAIDNCVGKARDDMTVMVIKINKN